MHKFHLCEVPIGVKYGPSPQIIDYLTACIKAFPRYPHFEEEYSINDIKPVAKVLRGSERGDKTLDSNLQSHKGIHKVGGVIGF